MKYAITPQNIKSIAKIIEKIAKDKSISYQMFYPHRKKQESIFKNIGIDKFIITKSNVCTFNEVIIEVDHIHEQYFIRVHNNERDTDMFDYCNFRAFIVNCGDIVEIKNNVVHLRTQHPTDRKCKANKIIKFIS